jgi:histidinol-phosphate aminotransferase
MHYYPDGSGFELKEVLAKSLSISPQQLTLGNGSENILELIIKAYLNCDYHAVMSEYAFLAVSLLLDSYEIYKKVIPAKDFGHDIPRMIDAVDEKTRVLFLINPNNPTGTFTHETDFFSLIEAVPSHVLIVVDEAYRELMTTPSYPNTLKYLSHYPNLIITRTFSKAYGLAGLRLGYAISSPQIADVLNRTRLPFNVNSIAAKAAKAAILDQDHIKKTVSLTQQGSRQLKNGLEALNLKYVNSYANFIAVDVGCGMTVYQKLLQEGVIVRPLDAYQMPNHVRVTVGTYAQNERFLKTMDRIITGKLK